MICSNCKVRNGVLTVVDLQLLLPFLPRALPHVVEGLR